MKYVKNPLIKEAARLVDGQTMLATKLTELTGQSVQAANIWNWIHRDKRVPAEYCLAIEAATSGAITAKALRPDVFGSL